MNSIQYLKKYGNPNTYEKDYARLQNGEPVQYIVGNVDFYGYNFIVNSNVLIPRFETEGLVEKIIQKAKRFPSPIQIVDLGTGSGCIAITLKKQLNCTMDAVDISEKALEIAKKNAEKNQAEIQFYKGNFLKPLKETYDIIVSNPPYIAYDEEIMEIVKNNEPEIALYAKENGLSCYYEILKNAKQYLKSNGMLAFEIGKYQGDILKEYAKKYFATAKISVEKDLQGNDRYLFIEDREDDL